MHMNTRQFITSEYAADNKFSTITIDAFGVRKCFSLVYNNNPTHRYGACHWWGIKKKKKHEEDWHSLTLVAPAFLNLCWNLPPIVI
jgi:hypothetical protein